MTVKNRVIGLTGQTGAGKSTVARLAEEMSCRVVDCDRIAGEALSPGSDCLKRLADCFGCDIIDSEGRCIRKLLAERAFASRERTDLLNRITHPWIIRRSEEYIERYKAEREGIIILDAALLYESGGDRLCDSVIAVIAPVELRLDRIMRRDGITRDEAMQRIRVQHEDGFYTSRADYVINGAQDLSLVEKELRNILKKIDSDEV